MERARDQEDELKINPDEIADRFIAAYNARHPDGVAELYASDGWHADAVTGHRKVGPDAVGKGLTSFLSAVSDAYWAETGRIVAGREVLVLYELNGRLTGRLGPFDGAGQPVSLPGAFALSVAEDGQIASSVDYWNPEIFACQIRQEGRQT